LFAPDFLQRFSTFSIRKGHDSEHEIRCDDLNAPPTNETGARTRLQSVAATTPWQANLGLGRFHGSRSEENSVGKPIKPGLKSRLLDDRCVAWAIAVSSARIRAPRHVLNAVFAAEAGPSPAPAPRA
jgi:hypothetical protein